MAGLAAGQPATTMGQNASAWVVACNDGTMQPCSHHKRMVAFHGWPDGLPHNQHTLPMSMHMPIRFRASLSQELGLRQPPISIFRCGAKKGKVIET